MATTRDTHGPGGDDVKPSQVVAFLDTSGGLDLDARRPWPGRRHGDESARPLDARALLGVRGAPVEWHVSARATDVLAPLRGDATATTRTPVRWDVDAWFQPVHLTAYDTGIVVRERAVLDLATDLAAHCARAGLDVPPTDGTARQLLRMAFTVLFLHQQFHHRVEMLALRMQVVEQRPRYVAYYREAYARAAGTDDQLEESLANAYVHRTLSRRAHCVGIPNELRRAVLDVVKRGWAHDEPGYRIAGDFLTPEAWDRGIGELHARVNEASMRPTRRATWRHLGPDLTASTLDVATDVAVVTADGEAPALPGTALDAPTCTAEQMTRILEGAGYAVPRRSRGSHVRLAAKGRAVAFVPVEGSLSPTATARLLELVDATPSDLPALLGPP
jgi:predicted RNA binding protein YcfA (HicA-like mRNA interferase family)